MQWFIKCLGYINKEEVSALIYVCTPCDHVYIILGPEGCCKELLRIFLQANQARSACPEAQRLVAATFDYNVRASMRLWPAYTTINVANSQIVKDRKGRFLVFSYWIS